ncbi:PilZ domain-containing protein [Arenimonas fontis]|uniref:PilZ domain-containing protein n=1 Tax=Arenimonas fontis TaxID=2608255 RepID=A0A5B2ZEV6_9GAMM|nr:PilZ domain-containing protein [Arenimonas fontis]KAA2286093.1 PilZ domain-containing protein [Arenimonas fontis]
MEDQRFSTRVPYAARVVVVRGGDAWLGEVVDLSEGGCGLFRPEACTLDVADIVQLIFFDEPGRAVLVPARVARVQDGLLGFEYHEPQQVPPVLKG